MAQKRICAVLFIILFCTVNLYARELAYNKMAEELSDAAKLLKNPKVAIIPFSYMDKRKSDGGIIVSERLTTRIVKIGKLKVVERQLIEKVLQELHFEMTEFVDVNATKEVGKILGVDAIVTGSLMDIGRNKVEVNARLIKTETAEVIATSSEQIKKEWPDEQVTISPVIPVTSPQPTGTYQLPPTPAPAQPAYKPVAATTYVQKPNFDMYFDFFLGSGSGNIDFSFENYSYPIDEVDVDLHLNSDGILSHNTYFNKISFGQMDTTDTTMPFVLRVVGFANTDKNKLSLGVGGEISYLKQALKKQRTTVTLNDSATYNFQFYVDDYLKVSTFIFSGDGFVQLNHEVFRPYIGLGLGMTINTVSSAHIYQYYGNVFKKPLSETGLGFLIRMPIGVRIMAGKNSSLIGEYRMSTNYFTFNRTIKNEVDRVTMSFNQFFIGYGAAF